MTELIISAVHHLVRDESPFVSALAQTKDAATAIARALEAIDADVERTPAPGCGAVSRLEALLHARLLLGLKRGDLPADLDVGDLSAFYTNVVVSLVVEALCGGDPARLAAIRGVALGVLRRGAAVPA